MSRKAKVRMVLCALVVVAPAFIFSQTAEKPKEKEEKPSGAVTLRIEVTGGENNQPVESASVYVQYAEERALKKEKKVNLNVKTNHQGSVRVPEVPRGKVRIQVVAEGWKPFGRWYEVEEAGQVIKIHLERPPKWY